MSHLDRRGIHATPAPPDNWRQMTTAQMQRFAMQLTRLEPKRTQTQRAEIAHCDHDRAYFLATYGYIENATQGDWIPFELWEAQIRVLAALQSHRQVIILKARQLGLTWLVLGYILTELLFNPITVALFFSRGENEAKELLARLKGMYSRLPPWMKEGDAIVDNSEEWRLPSLSRALSFPTTGGRSYTASIVVVDEADFVRDLNAVINAVKPTIDAGGRMIVVSTVDKSQPNSPFKKMYRGAKAKASLWLPIFLAWHARPERTPEWYAEQSADVMARTGGSLDDLHQEYPATDTEALAPRSQDKRIAAMWIEACYEPLEGITDASMPALPGLTVYRLPVATRHYVIGADPAEGNPSSDDSAACVVDYLTGEEMATLAGKFEPGVFAAYIGQLSAYYNHAAAMIERNNHGHSVILWIADHAPMVALLWGHDQRPGWMSSSLGKHLLYTEATNHFQQNAAARITVLHSEESYTQLASIEAATLRAPKDFHDDHADAYAFGQVGRAALAEWLAAQSYAQSHPDGLLTLEEDVRISPY